jgi:8-oxo-dGTP pyrophosphatase MutT (NUDIX family)
MSSENPSSEENPSEENPSEENPSEESPWVTLSAETVYENAWISVSHRQVVRPDGAEGIYGVVHFRNRAAAIVPLDGDGNTWLVGQYRYTTSSYSWEVPEGGVPHHEDLFEGARRELREETGIEAGSLVQINRSHLSNSVTDEEAFVFVATDLRFGDAEPEGTEQLQLRKVPFQLALQLVDDSVITDAFSVVALLATDRWLRAKAQ